MHFSEAEAGTNARRGVRGGGSRDGTSGGRDTAAHTTASSIAVSARHQSAVTRRAAACEQRAARCGTAEIGLGSVAVQSSSGAPTISLGLRKLFPVNRKIVARSTRRSAVATAVASDGKRLFHLVKPVLAVRTIEP